eukprot:TRINITY_DN4211_c0_g1_i1.p1 TRINITY_DN4211_c0_g1~~TRINITY_DN4211_c0_g1_i1.p1  ORF type:complete len:614 (+),score=132.94 TRINITY_DN4211_c0_g1_i1:277-1842(+)
MCSNLMYDVMEAFAASGDDDRLGEAVKMFWDVSEIVELPTVLMRNLTKAQRFEDVFRIAREFRLRNPEKKNILLPEVNNLVVMIQSGRVDAAFSSLQNILFALHATLPVPHARKICDALSDVGADDKISQVLDLVTANNRSHGILLKYAQPSGGKILIRSENPISMRSLFRNLAMKGDLVEAEKLLDRMSQRNVANLEDFNVMATAYVKHGNLEKGMECVDTLGTDCDSTTLNSVMIAFLKLGKIEEALKLFEVISARTQEPDWHTFNSLVFHSAEVDIDISFWVFERMRESGVSVAPPTARKLVHRLVALQKMQNAREVLKMFPQDSTVFNAFLTGLTGSGNLDIAVKELESNLHPTDEQSFSIILSAFGKEGNVERFLDFIQRKRDAGFTPSDLEYASIIKYLTSEKRISEATKVFTHMRSLGVRPSTPVCNLFLFGLCGRRDPQTVKYAMEVYLTMKADGSQPNEVTLNTLLRYFLWCQAKPEAIFIHKEFKELGIAVDATTQDIIERFKGRIKIFKF